MSAALHSDISLTRMELCNDIASVIIETHGLMTIEIENISARVKKATTLKELTALDLELLTLRSMICAK